MAAVSLQCPICAGKMTIDSRLCGQQLTCNACRALITAPAFETARFPATSLSPPPPPPQPSQAPPTASVPRESLLQLACPQCGGVFHSPVSKGGSLLPCPHCRSSIAIPISAWQSAPLAPPPPTSHVANRPVPLPAPTAALAKAPASDEREAFIRRLTPKERAQRRLHRNLILLVVGGLLLLGSLYIVLRLGPWS
jgi:hypothetical protein